jgi:atypical dual specificity phosphatase
MRTSVSNTSYNHSRDSISHIQHHMGKKKHAAPLSGKKQPAACIVPGLLYLGPVNATSDAEYLKREGITHILSVGKSPQGHFDGMSYERLRLTDEEDSDIGYVVARACEYIDAVAAANGKVLVHCVAAISRSPTVVAAYLMLRRGMKLRESLETLVEARPAVAPNPGFMRQLAAIEKDAFDGVSTFDPADVTAKTKLASCL